MKKSIIMNCILLAILYCIPSPNIYPNLSEEVPEEVSENIAENFDTNAENIETPKQEIATTISERGIEFIRSHEGCILTSVKYKGEKFYTIGYGHCQPDVSQGQTISKEKAEEMLLKDLEYYSDIVNKKCKHLNLNQNQFDALVSFTYNLGAGNLSKLIKNRTTKEIANHIESYYGSGNSANEKGLKNRRTAEKNYFMEV